MQTKLLINGKLTPGDGEVEEVLNPATGKVLARLGEASREQVNAAVTAADAGWRRTVSRAVTAGIPAPAHSAALAFYDSYRAARLPANLIQALRDYFGAHGYERVDRPRGEWFHTDWAGTGGDVAAGTYQA